MLSIGIDATNIRNGGGLSHLIELLSAARPKRDRFKNIFVFASKDTLNKLPDRVWLKKFSAQALEGGLLRRILWQKFFLKKKLKAAGCNILFVPGTSFITDFKPIVCMSQNILPFEWKELFRYNFSLMTIKLILLRFVHSKCLKAADGIIFLTNYAKKSVLKVTGKLKGTSCLISHGLNKRFFASNQIILNNKFFFIQKPIRIIYVSIIDHYKHQWNVVKAIALARKQSKINFQLNLVGPANKSALKKLNTVIAKEDPKLKWVSYHGVVGYQKIHSFYKESHIGIWASTCETFGLILLEMMAAGLPLLCSNRGPSREILGNAGLYFNPESPNSLCRALLRLIKSKKKIEFMIEAKKKASIYSWKRCAKETFNFIFQVEKNSR